MRKLILPIVVLVVALATAAVALGGDDRSGSTAQPAVKQTKKNIVQTAVGAGDFDTLVSLVKRAGLAKTLSGKGPFTVFAPTDAAFDKVPKATLARLGRDKAALRSVLLLHVAKGRLTAAEVTKRRAVETLNGQRLAIRVRGAKVFVARAAVVTPDVTALNGVIHAINKVLLPR